MAKPPIDWTALQADYETRRFSMTELAQKYALNRSTLYRHAIRHGWAGKTGQKPVSRAALICRLYRILQTQITQLETELTMAGDKEVALLGALTRNLEKLMEMERKEQGADADKVQKPARDIAALRAKLAKRLDALKRA